MTVRELRPYQAEAVAGVHDEWRSGITRTGVILPTGCGKTDIIGKIATDEARAGGRVLVVAHRRELLGQISERCGMHAPEIPVGWVQAGRNETRRPITVGMMQTLAGERRRKAMPKPTLLIVDECHHAVSPSYMDILAWAGSFDRVRTLGVTATMVRGDKRKLGDVWQSIAFERDLPWAVRSGWLVPPRGRVVVADHVDLERAKISRGDFQDNELGDMVVQDVDQIVQAWLDQAGNRITAAFLPNVESAHAMTAAFLAQGVPAETVIGTTPDDERDRIYARLAAGETRVMCGVMVATEGWDCPPVSCILQARPTRQRGLYIQMVGRGLRPSPGKVDCLVLDVVGASRHQSLVTLPDLSTSPEYDVSELDALPCDTCGGYVGSPPPHGVHRCACHDEPEELDGEGAGRDPDGGRVRLQRPAAYEDIDLFSQSELDWQFTRKGVRFLPVGGTFVVCWPDSGRPGELEQTYSVGHPGTWLAERVSLAEAGAIAERWARGQGVTLYGRDAAWRKASKRASDGQVAMARRYGVDVTSMTSGAASQAIDVARASKILDRVL